MIMIDEQSFPLSHPHPPSPKKDDPLLFPPQQHNNKRIKIILLHPQPPLFSEHPQFVAVKSLIWLPPN